MPQAIVLSAVGAGVSTYLATSAAIAAAGGLMAYFQASFITSLVLGVASQALSKKPSASTLSDQGQTITSRQAVAAHQIIYGRTRVGGNIVYMHTTDSNKYLHMVIAVAGHEIDAFESFYANDEQLTIDANGFTESGSTYGNKIRVKYAVGSHTTQPFTDLQTETAGTDGEWTSNHLLRGSALVYVRLEYDQDKFPNGIPNFSFLIRGKKVYDPRSESTVWSSNPALCLNDYLTSTYGLGSIYASEINEATLISSANICDEDVPLDAGGTENKYEAHGAISTSSTPSEAITKILTSMAGKAVWSQGKWRILAGAYYTPELSFDESDLRSGIRVQTLVSRRENFNTVKGVFLSSVDNYIATDFPQVQNSTAVIEDGEEVFKSIELPFTTSASMAQRLAKIDLLKARQQITTSLPLKLHGLKANVGDIVNVNNTRLGWSNKKFEVVGMNMSLGESLGVDLDLREISTDVFDWSTAEEQSYDPAPNTNLPNSFQVLAPTDLAIVATNTLAPDGTTQSGLLITWTPPVNSFVIQYEVQYIRGASNFDWGSITNNAIESVNYGSIADAPDSTADYGNITDTTASGEIEYNSVFVTTPYYVIPTAVAGAQYAVRVRAINALGVRSSFVTSNETTYGDTTPPNVPSEITATGGYKEISLTWINPTVSDFDYVEVYRSQTNSINSAVRVGVLRGSKFVDTGLDISVTRYYWLKSVDRSGNKSDFSSPVSATTIFIDSDSFSQEVLNLFSEAGAYGIEPVATLPASGDFNGQIKYDTTLNKLYRWDATAIEWTDDIFSITSGSVDEASFAAGIEPVKIVSELPNPSGYTGAKIVFLTTDNKLYRYDGAAWISSIATSDLTGTLAASNFAQDLRPVEVVSSLPSSGNFQGRVVVLTTDSKLYRYTGSAWTAAVPTADLSGTISAAQIASVAAASVTGTLTNDQIADLATAKLTGTISETQITDGAISTAKLAAGSVSTAKLAAGAVTADTISSNAITSAKIEAGAITTAKIAAGAIDAGKIAADAVTADKIAANAVTADSIAAESITTAKIAAGAVTTDILAANAITASKIAANTITADQMAANTLTAGTIASGAISTDELAANAVTSTKIATNAITADKILAGSIQTDKIAANAITGGLIAASGVITSAAQIDDAVITNAKIASAAITTAKIGDLQVTGVKIANGAITLSAFGSDNGFIRYFTSGTFTPASGTDTFASLTFPSQLNDDITIEAHFILSSTDDLVYYNEYAGAAVQLRPMISLGNVEQTSYKLVPWSRYESTSHVPVNLKARIVGTGSNMTVQLRVFWYFGNWYNPQRAEYKVSSCIISAFSSRK